MSSASGEPLLCVGALIIDGAGRIFVHRRSATRRLFPNCWDVVGGHVEPGETLLSALDREITEETGWRLSRVLAIVGEHTWTGNDGPTRRETDYLVEVSGDLTAPRLEVGKQDEYRWLAEGELSLLSEHRETGDILTRQIVESAFAAARAVGHPGNRSLRRTGGTDVGQMVTDPAGYPRRS
jgi:8-oxo-dGTP diphosphatase